MDVHAGHPLTLRDAMGSAHAMAGATHAKAAGQRLARQLGAEHQPRVAEPESGELLLRAGRDLEVALLRRGCASPTLGELMALHGGTLDDDDLGLGAGFGLLTRAIRDLSGLHEPAELELDGARLFLAEWGVTLDAMGKRYGLRPSAFLPGELPERERLALDLGVYYWARGEDALDEAWRRRSEQLRRT